MGADSQVSLPVQKFVVFGGSATCEHVKLSLSNYTNRKTGKLSLYKKQQHGTLPTLE